MLDNNYILGIILDSAFALVAIVSAIGIYQQIMKSLSDDGQVDKDG